MKNPSLNHFQFLQFFLFSIAISSYYFIWLYLCMFLNYHKKYSMKNYVMVEIAELCAFLSRSKAIYPIKCTCTGWRCGCHLTWKIQEKTLFKILLGSLIHEIWPLNCLRIFNLHLRKYCVNKCDMGAPQDSNYTQNHIFFQPLIKIN